VIIELIIRVAVALSLLFAAPAYAGSDSQKVCTITTVDAVFGFDMSGKPRLAPDQLLLRMIACDDNAYLQMVSANAEQDRLWEFMVDLLTGEIVLASEDQQQVNHTPAQTDCTPTQVYYGCGEWRR
jgi:hypothetical protein